MGRKVDKAWAEHALYALQAAGYRRGGARTAVVEALSGHDCAVTAIELDEELRREGIEMIAPHRSNRVRSLTQDRRRLRRYARRWLVERFFAWIQWRRRLLVRWEFYPQNFLGFVQLACLLILFRQF